MGTVFDEDSNRPAKAPGTLPQPLAQLLTATRANTAGVMERLSLQAQTGETPFIEVTGTEYLLFSCGNVGCGVPLAALREVLPALPLVAPLPASPEWMMGIFALRAEMIALIDPVPILLESPGESPDTQRLPAYQPAPAAPSPARDHAQFASEPVPQSALIVGSGERCLAWAIALIGDIVRLEEYEIAPHASGGAAAGAGRVRQRYVAGDYVVPQDGRRYTLLRTEFVLDDVLHALEEEPDGRA